jgi:MoaA/NifB/PqqE/SkfB family radical SAM enzyme
MSAELSLSNLPIARNTASTKPASARSAAGAPTSGSAATPRLRRTSRRADARVALAIIRAAIDRDKPLIANLIITRRCNLSCGYCFEYDKVSPPVPTETLKERIDHIARLGSVFITFTGGESLLHPDADELVAYARKKGLVPFLNTNGYLLTKSWIERLNKAGLYGMQISIDNVKPNDVSAKSLKTLLPKLRILAEHARFRVRINCVLGSSPPAEAVEVARAVIGFGFDMNTSLVRAEDGTLLPVTTEMRAAYETIRGMGRRAPAYLDDDYTRPLMENGESEWKCRAGARTFHVDEYGLVHLCAPRTGTPAKPIAAYTVEDIRYYFNAPKTCASKCPVAYARHASRLDGWRSQGGQLMQLSAPAAEPPLVQIRLGKSQAA